MCDLADRLARQHQSFAERTNLQLVAKEQTPEFGGSACLVYSDGTVSVMITKSRDGVNYLCTDGNWQSGCWHSVDILWNHLRQNAKYRNMKRVNELHFLEENFTQIADIFQPAKRSRTAQELHQLELSRSKLLFG